MTDGDTPLSSIMRFVGQETIEDKMDLVILAAGKHDRFPGPEPKCLRIVDGDPILERLLKCVPNYTPLIVCRSDLETEYADRLEGYGHVLKVSKTETQGQTMSWVLSYLPKGRHVCFVSADTFPMIERPIPLPPWPDAAIFDPYAWITILTVTNTQIAENQMATCLNKLDYMQQNWTPAILVSHPWRNINSPDNVAAAEVVLHKLRGET